MTIDKELENMDGDLEENEGFKELYGDLDS